MLRNGQLNGDFYAYIDKYIGLPSNETVFKVIPKNLDIHSYRAEFSCTWYEKLARKEKYYCRGDKKGVVFDRRAMLQVSKMLRHERIYVIATHYLWKRVYI